MASEDKATIEQKIRPYVSQVLMVIASFDYIFSHFKLYVSAKSK